MLGGANVQESDLVTQISYCIYVAWKDDHNVHYTAICQSQLIVRLPLSLSILFFS
jgi:hypothetical protein